MAYAPYCSSGDCGASPAASVSASVIVVSVKLVSTTLPEYLGASRATIFVDHSQHAADNHQNANDVPAGVLVDEDHIDQNENSQQAVGDCKEHGSHNVGVRFAEFHCVDDTGNAVA